jgi:hypothetical protein
MQKYCMVDSMLGKPRIKATRYQFAQPHAVNNAGSKYSDSHFKIVSTQIQFLFSEATTAPTQTTNYGMEKN